MHIVLTNRLLFHGFPMTKNNGRGRCTRPRSLGAHLALRPAGTSTPRGVEPSWTLVSRPRGKTWGDDEKKCGIWEQIWEQRWETYVTVNVNKYGNIHLENMGNIWGKKGKTWELSG